MKPCDWNEDVCKFFSSVRVNGKHRVLNFCTLMALLFTGSIESLRHTDVTLLESIERQGNALLEHGRIHDNLTLISDGVSWDACCLLFLYG